MYSLKANKTLTLFFLFLLSFFADSLCFFSNVLPQSSHLNNVNAFYSQHLQGLQGLQGLQCRPIPVFDCCVVSLPLAWSSGPESSSVTLSPNKVSEQFKGAVVRECLHAFKGWWVRWLTYMQLPSRKLQFISISSLYIQKLDGWDKGLKSNWLRSHKCHSLTKK